MLLPFTKILTWLLTELFRLVNSLARIIQFCGKSLGAELTTEDIVERQQIKEALRLSEEKFAKAFGCSPHAIIISRLKDGCYIDVNNSFLDLIGYEREEVIGRTALELNIWVNPEDRTSFKRMLEQKGAVRNIEIACRTKSGEARVGILSAEIIDLSSELCILTIACDITELKQTEQALLAAKATEAAKLALEKEVVERQQVEEALRLSEEKFAKAFRSSPDLIIISTLSDGRYIEVNDIFLHKSGYSREEVIGHTTTELNFWVNAEERTKMKQILWQQGTCRNLECNFRTKTGAVGVGLLSAEIMQIGGQQCILSVIRDITDRKQAEEQLRHNAFHDALTGLPNRALLMERLKHALDRSQGHAACSFAVLFLDLDRFKVINDSLGHAAGDQLLVEIARRLEKLLRSGDTVARLGGDEFTILLEDVQNNSDTINIAKRLIETLKLPFNLNNCEVYTSASIGIAFSSVTYCCCEDILRDADIAMYRAKSKGGARYAIFDPDMHTRAVARLQLETDLRRAIERQEFQVYYQPIISLQSLKLTGFEALVRWQHPSQGLIPPGEFIPLAEETGLIKFISNWVLYEACRQIKLWQTKFPRKQPLTIGVNLSSKQFADSSLVEEIHQILQQTGLAAYNLTLEITESVIMENSELANDMLVQLKSLGIQLGIDDFGTGYSSLSYLHSFPIDILKIDRSFITRMSLDSESWAIVHTITTLAHNLGIAVIAEGVENLKQLTQLMKLGCEYGQGFFFFKAMSADLTEALITEEMKYKNYLESG